MTNLIIGGQFDRRFFFVVYILRVFAFPYFYCNKEHLLRLFSIFMGHLYLVISILYLIFAIVNYYTKCINKRVLYLLYC